MGGRRGYRSDDGARSMGSWGGKGNQREKWGGMSAREREIEERLARRVGPSWRKEKGKGKGKGSYLLQLLLHARAKVSAKTTTTSTRTNLKRPSYKFAFGKGVSKGL